MKKFVSIVSILFLSACAVQQHEVSPMGRAKFSNMTCEVLNNHIFNAYFKMKDLKSHYVHTKPHFETFADIMGAHSTEMKEIEKVRQYHNDAAQIYNERKCGGYITTVKYDVPVRGIDY